MGMATIPVKGPQTEQFEDVEIQQWILDCPVFFDWCVFKGETYFGMLNYERSIKARRPMIDLAYCATKGMNGCVLYTVAYDKKHFGISPLAVLSPHKP